MRDHDSSSIQGDSTKIISRVLYIWPYKFFFNKSTEILFRDHIPKIMNQFYNHPTIIQLRHLSHEQSRLETLLTIKSEFSFFQDRKIHLELWFRSFLESCDCVYISLKYFLITRHAECRNCWNPYMQIQFQKLSALLMNFWDYIPQKRSHLS